MTNVVIPNSVSSIGSYAFQGASLKNANIPTNITYLGDNAFESCQLTGSLNIKLLSTNTSIGNEVFSFCTNLTSVIVNIDNHYYHIGFDMFFGCASLTNAVIGPNLVDPGYEMFGFCEALTTVYFLGNSPTNEPSFFYNDGNSIHCYYLPGTTGWGSTFGGFPVSVYGVPWVNYTYQTNTGTISYNSYTGGGSVAVPSTIAGVPVTTIGASAFSGNASVTSVTIGANVTSIGDSAFYNCSGLTSVTMGSSVTSIGNSSFYGCSHMTSISIGNNITSIGNSSFNGCSDLTSISIGNHVTSIGNSAFNNCSGLTSLSLGNSVNSIGTSAFNGCSGLTSVTIPDSVASIGNNAFSYCSGLLTVTIGKGVISIGTGAFSFSTSLQQAFFKGDAPSVNGGAGSADSTLFQGDTGTAYYVPGNFGWGATFGGWPTAGWYQPQPQILDNRHGLGVQGNRFNLPISWATTESVVVQTSSNLLNWTSVATNTLVNGTNIFSDAVWTNYPKRFYRVLDNLPAGMALIPPGSFKIGDTLDGESDAVPTNIYDSQFFMDTNLVSYSQWQTVYSYATTHGYGFDNVGTGKATNHPVQTVSWYDCVKWCNARSAQAGLTPVYYTDSGLTQVYTSGQLTPYVNWNANGYRLPTEAEWEKAARGGLAGQRFPLANTISESQANYDGNTAYSYDLGPNGYNTIGNYPTTSPGTTPVNSFPSNGYGLNDMAGNVFVWCWDWYAGPAYPAGSPYLGGTDPRGPVGPLSYRVLRGGCWADPASYARCAFQRLRPDLRQLRHRLSLRAGALTMPAANRLTSV